MGRRGKNEKKFVNKTQAKLCSDPPPVDNFKPPTIPECKEEEKSKTKDNTLPIVAGHLNFTTNASSSKNELPDKITSPYQTIDFEDHSQGPHHGNPEDKQNEETAISLHLGSQTKLTKSVSHNCRSTANKTTTMST